jgi:LmbE family N-acetylglucosaminyl deacetylase
MISRVVLALAGLCCCAHAQDGPAANPYILPQQTVRQLPANQGATALWETLQRLHTRASLLMIVAHPDDEDGGMLTYESRGLGVRTGMLTLTRGEGGQNVMTGDFNDALGLIRTQELLAADRYFGIDQMWGTVADFGFSKTMDETLANWGYQRVLCDAVRAVRVYRPLVVTSVFIGGVTDGHGHHQVVGRLAQEVFNVAGDPNVCPDQIAEGLQPWQPLKVYERVPTYSISPKGIYDYATGKYAPAKFYSYITKTWSNETPSTNVVIPEGTYSPLLGMSYLQFARIGLGQQLSQYGGSALPAAGTFDVAYHLYGQRVSCSGGGRSTVLDENCGIRPGAPGFFQGIQTSLGGIHLLAPEDKELPNELTAIDRLVAQAMHEYSVTDTAKVAPLLHDGLKKTTAALERIQASSLPEREKYDVAQELKRKQAQFNEALVESLGLSIRAQVASASSKTSGISLVQASSDTLTAATPGETFPVEVQINFPSSVRLTAPSIHIAGVSNAIRIDDQNGVACNVCTLGENHPEIQRFNISIPADASPTRPYFTRPSIEQPYYNIADASLRGQSTSPYPLTAWATVNYNGMPITLGEIVQTAHRVVGQGVVYQPLVIVPAISIALQPTAGIIPLDATTLHLTAHIHGDEPEGGSGSVHLKLPAGWTASPTSAPFHLTHRSEETTIDFTVTPQHLSAQSYTIAAIAESNGKQYTEGYTTVGYPGLPPTNIYRSATWRASGVDVHIAPGLRIAYLMGTGDDVPASLAALGVLVHPLTTSDLATADLSQFDEIILGVRAYTAHPELEHLQSRLAKYTEAGGVVIVQYNSAPFASTAEHPLAPYPLSLGSFAENVVDEHAAVSLLSPSHPLLTWPNTITPQDFDNWIAERGHSFLHSWDEHYVPLTETHDADQDPQRGGLLYARSGCGAYVYVAYALYRQLPEGVPGAYRIFANLLSLPKNTHAETGPGCTLPR